MTSLNWVQKGYLLTGLKDTMTAFTFLVWGLEGYLEISRLRAEPVKDGPGASLSENSNSSWQLTRKVYITTGSAEAQKDRLLAPLLLVRLGLPTPALWLPELQGAWEMSSFNPIGSSE